MKDRRLMYRSVPRLVNACRLAAAAAVSTIALLLAACGGGATLPVQSDSSSAGTAASATLGKDIVTQSDEPEKRKRARLRMELASSYFERGQTTTALDEIKQSLSIDPAYADAYTLRGMIYMQLQQAQTAEESFRRALQLEPNNADANHNYGWFLCRNNRLSESYPRFQAAANQPLYVGVARSWLALGVCQLRGGFTQEAETSLYKSFELDPSNPATATNLALLHFRKNDMEKARFYARKVNNTELANSESLWLGMRIENRLQNTLAVNELGAQLTKRFPQSREARLYQRGAFNEQ
jgi:type IV pilus assembly protein PilF